MAENFLTMLSRQGNKRRVYLHAIKVQFEKEHVLGTNIVKFRFCMDVDPISNPWIRGTALEKIATAISLNSSRLPLRSRFLLSLLSSPLLFPSLLSSRLSNRKSRYRKIYWHRIAFAIALNDLSLLLACSRGKRIRRCATRDIS